VVTPTGDEVVLSGSIGSAFGPDAEAPTRDFGASLSWLGPRAVGVELLTGFAPDFDPTAGTFGNPVAVDNYMVNAIGALPMGDAGRWQPFVSGGLGAVALRSAELSTDLGFDKRQTTSLGYNVGGGLMAFADRWGVRADMRYTADAAEADAGTRDEVLDDLGFWRGNVGVAYRW
jgi:hypothetical protein